MFGPVAKILSGAGLTGSLICIENIPPFIVKFLQQPEMYDDNFGVEYEMATYPGSRYQYPVFKGCSPHEVRFTLRYDLSRNSAILGGLAESILDVVNVDRQTQGQEVLLSTLNPLNLTASPGYKGTNNTANDVLKITQTDIISRMRAAFETMKLPKSHLGKAVINVAGSMLRVSTSSGEPAPPLCILIRNPSKYYAGYIGEANIKELQYDNAMYCERIEIDVKFLVTPDLVFTTLNDAVRFVSTALNVLNFA